MSSSSSSSYLAVTKVAATSALGACAWYVSTKCKVLYDGLERKLDAERRRVEDDLEAHFVSVQRICDKTALPAVVPRLKYALQSHLDMTAQLRVLRAPSTSATVSSQQKLRAWEDLKILAFTRVAASSLSLAILSLHMRIMLNVLSRQLYLEHALEAAPSIHTKVKPRLVCFISHPPIQAVGIKVSVYLTYALSVERD